MENKGHNEVLTYPYDSNDNSSAFITSSLVYAMGTKFLKAIVICFMSRRDSLEESMEAVTIGESSQVNKTPKKQTMKPQYFEAPDI